MKHSTFLLRSLTITVIIMVASAGAYAKALIPFGVLDQKPWTAQFYYATIASGDTPGEDWMTANFNDSEWGTVTGPIVNGTLSYSNTTWEIANTTYWVRCHFTPTAEDLTKFLYLYIANDYTCEAYINGVQVYNVTSAANYNIIAVNDEARAAMKAGQDNVLAVKVSDTNGGTRYMDFGLYASDFNDAVTRSDVPLTWQNDADNPWIVEGYTIIRRDNNKSYYDSWLTMNYTSTYRTELSFEWLYDYQVAGQLYIDGVFVENCGTGHTYYYFGNRHFVLEPGEHVIQFRDTVAGRDARKHFEIRNINVKEIRPLETCVLSENSKPLTFVNNDNTPWTIEDGFIQWRNWGQSYSGSKIATTFTVDKTSKLQFDYVAYRDDGNTRYDGNQNLIVYLNGIKQNTYYGVRDYTTWLIGLEPGDYTLEIEDTVYNDGAWFTSKIKNFELSNNWVNVELATPGTLGYEALYTPGIDVLNDVEFIKVKGKMNDADWTDIMNMQNLKALDLSEAIITSVPDYAFDGKTLLNSVILPEGITSIGTYAFRGTNIRRINIPSTVTIIKARAFQSTPLMYLTFTEGSQLKTIEGWAFASCKLLQEVALPAQLETIGVAAFEYCESIKSVTMGDAVTYIEGWTFHGANAMQSIRFSDALEEIRPYMCRETHELAQVHLPANLKQIDELAFYDTPKLTEIEFPASVELIAREAFNYSAVESVKLPINLQWLGENAFSNNSNLKYIEFPSFIEQGNYTRYYWYSYYSEFRSDGQPSGYRANFQACPNIEKIVMRSATPPVINSDPFAGSRDKTVITLVVPSFAVVNYKLDTYWKQFGSIVEGDDVDYWKITSPLMLTNNRRMQGKPDVDLYYNGQLTVGGAAPMTMKDFNMYINEDTPGRLLNTCDDVTADNITTRFSVAANKWYFFTPLHDVAVADITVTNNASYVIRYYDATNRATNGPTGSWKNVDTEKLIAGQGYIFYCNTACEITFPAGDNGQAQLFTTTDVTTNLVTNVAETAANSSWNYVGNPYPCYYDIYYMGFSAPITVWTGSTYKAYSIADDDFVLRPMQSFFVQKPDAVDKIVFGKSGRQLLSTVSSHAAAGAKGIGLTSRQIFNVQITNAGSDTADETRVVLNDNANMGYEMECDASKFMSMNADVPQLYTTDADGNAYAINERPKQNGIVALAYYAGEEGQYTISAKRADGTILLIDNEEDKAVDLTEGDYTFYSEATNGVNDTRFTLKLDMGSATAIDGVKVETDAADGDIYDLSGRKTNAVQSGIYIQKGQKVAK
ncbi:MAG: leucine-rich repeat domain-containing protein [Prevotella sp.]|nr:leucine-rich repeat domain-containing protein [Prevotella sp.]